MVKHSNLKKVPNKSVFFLFLFGFSILASMAILKYFSLHSTFFDLGIFDKISFVNANFYFQPPFLCHAHLFSLFYAFLYKLFHTGIVFTWYGAVVAASVAAFPIFVKSSRAAIEAVDRNLIKVSYTLGKGELQTFFKIVLPLAKKGIVAALILSFARALGEFGATLMLAGNIPFKTNTIPLEIYSAVSGGDFQKANILTAITAVISIAIIYLINRLTQGGKRW